MARSIIPLIGDDELEEAKLCEGLISVHHQRQDNTSADERDYQSGNPQYDFEFILFKSHDRLFP
jgi:hypothetical protein